MAHPLATAGSHGGGRAAGQFAGDGDHGLLDCPAGAQRPEQRPAAHRRDDGQIGLSQDPTGARSGPRTLGRRVCAAKTRQQRAGKHVDDGETLVARLGSHRQIAAERVRHRIRGDLVGRLQLSGRFRQPLGPGLFDRARHVVHPLPRKTTVLPHSSGRISSPDRRLDRGGHRGGDCHVARAAFRPADSHAGGADGHDRSGRLHADGGRAAQRRAARPGRVDQPHDGTIGRPPAAGSPQRAIADARPAWSVDGPSTAQRGHGRANGHRTAPPRLPATPDRRIARRGPAATPLDGVVPAAVPFVRPGCSRRSPASRRCVVGGGGVGFGASVMRPRGNRPAGRPRPGTVPIFVSAKMGLSPLVPCRPSGSCWRAIPRRCGNW